jgi:hypothetical protein
MKKFILIMLVAFSATAMAQNVAVSTYTGDWWPQLNQAATNLTTPDGWYYRTNVGSERLAFDGNVVPGTSCATTFGTIGAPYTDMTIKFDMTMPAPGSGKSSIIVLGSNAQWGGQGIVIEYTEFGVRAVKNFDYGGMVWIGSGSGYTTVLGAGGLIAGNEINISVTGLITLKFGAFVCPTSYQADVAVLGGTFVLVCPNATGFKFKNVSATKGATTVAYFPTPVSTSVSKINDTKLSIYPNPTKSNITIASDAVGKAYSVKNVLGQNILNGTITSVNQKVNLSNQKAGAYMLTIEGENSKIVRTVLKN